jgi:hypothetical protein
MFYAMMRIETFLPYDENTARSITREGKRMIRKMAKYFNLKKVP